MTAIPYQKLETDYVKVSNAVYALEQFTAQAKLPSSLAHLIKLRASQINGCHFCMAMHCKEARDDGEQQIRLDLLSAWRESDFFSDEEKLTLAWTECLTTLEDVEKLRAVQLAMVKHWGEAKFMAITSLIMAINSWNRLALSCDLSPRELEQ